MPSQLFAVVPDDRYIVLQLQVPNMDAETCDEMLATLLDQLAQRSAPVILDLSRAKFLPSLAIGSLVSMKKHLDDANSVVTIAGLSPNIRRVMQVSNLDKIFRLVDRLDQATA